GARRTFLGTRVWSAKAELDELYAKNDAQHRAIYEAIAAGSAQAARVLAREHVLSSGRLIETVLDALGSQARDPGGGGGRSRRFRNGQIGRVFVATALDQLRRPLAQEPEHELGAPHALACELCRQIGHV